jgi:hypothetical protein
LMGFSSRRENVAVLLGALRQVLSQHNDPLMRWATSCPSHLHEKALWSAGSGSSLPCCLEPPWD